MSQHDPNSTRRNDVPFERGHVVWVEKVSSVESRPFLVLSSGTPPERRQEYVGVPLSTTEQEDTVRIGPDDWKIGGLDESSFALVWRLQSFPHAAITDGIGSLEDDIVQKIVEAAKRYLGPIE